MPADASFRRYFRISGAQQRALLMDAPPPQEDVRPFVKIANHLSSLGFSTPQVYAVDQQQGFLILEDFGDDTYTRLLAAGEDELALYELGVDVLCALHSQPAAADVDVPAYDAATCVDEAQLLCEWYVPRALAEPLGEACKTEYGRAWSHVFSALPAARNSLILRDYHVDNLMRVADREGVATCGLLDFQDAVIGPTAYDVVSLLEDARRDISATLTESMLNRYRLSMGLSDREFEDFMLWYHVLGAQRHCRVLGVFVRLFERDGKDVYLKHLPRLERLLRLHLGVAQLRPLKQWFECYLNASLF